MQSGLLQNFDYLVRWISVQVFQQQQLGTTLFEDFPDRDWEFA